MSDATFTFRVDADLKSQFAAAAKACDRTGAQLLRDFMRGVVSQERDVAKYDAWFRREVEAALAEANDPATAWVPDEQTHRDSAAWRRRVLATGKVSR